MIVYNVTFLWENSKLPWLTVCFAAVRGFNDNYGANIIVNIANKAVFSYFIPPIAF